MAIIEEQDRFASNNVVSLKDDADVLIVQRGEVTVEFCGSAALIVQKGPIRVVVNLNDGVVVQTGDNALPRPAAAEEAASNPRALGSVHASLFPPW